MVKKPLRYNEIIRKYEEYFSVSYYEAYIELLRFKKDITGAFQELVKELPITTVKQQKKLNKLYKEIEKLNKTTSRVEYYNTNSRAVFRELLDYIDLKKFVKEYDLMFNGKSAPRGYGDRVLKALSKEYSKLMETNQDFRDLVCVLLFSVKGSKFYIPLILSAMYQAKEEDNSTQKEIITMYQLLKETKDKLKEENNNDKEDI